MGSSVGAVLHAGNVGREPEGCYNFVLNKKKVYSVEVSDRWRFAEVAAGKLLRVDGPDRNPVQYRKVQNNQTNQVESGWFVVDNNDHKKILRRASPPVVLLITKLDSGKSLAIKAAKASDTDAVSLLKRERDFVMGLYPEGQNKLPTEIAITFKYRGENYVGYAQERVPGVSLKEAVKYIVDNEPDKSVAVAKVLNLYKAVLAEYQRIGRIPYDVSHGNIFVLSNKQGVPALGPDGKQAKIRLLDIWDGFDGHVVGNQKRHTYGSRDIKMFAGNNRAYATFACFYAFHEMLHTDLVKVGCPDTVLAIIGEHFKPDAVVDTSKGRRASDAMFDFYDALVAEMQMGNQEQAAAVPMPVLQKNSVVVRLAKNLSDLYGCVQHILEVADPEGNDPDYDALRDYRDENGTRDATGKWQIALPGTASTALGSIQSANRVVMQAKCLADAGKFKHRAHARYRKGGDLALSNNKGALAGIILGIFLGGIIPGLVAWIVMANLEAQQTKRERQVQDMRYIWKKPPALGSQSQPPSIFSQLDPGDFDSHEPLASRSSFSDSFGSRF